VDGKMKKTIIGAILVCLAMTGPVPVCCGSLYSDKIVAVVNGDVILESDVKKHKLPVMRNLMNLPLGVIPPGKWPTEKEILDELVIIQLMEQEAARKSVKVDDRAVDASIESIKKRNNLADDQFAMFLAASGLTIPDYRKVMKRSYLLNKLIAGEVTQKIPLSEEDAVDYFKKHKDEIDDVYKKLTQSVAPPQAQQAEAKMPEIPTHEELNVGGKLRLRQITLKLPTDGKRRDVEKVMEKARQIYDEARTGADFGQLAKKHSQDSSAKSGGDLGSMNYNDMVPNFQKLVERLKEGDITPPLQTPNAVIIFYLQEAKGRTIKKVPIPKRQREEWERRWREEKARREAEIKKQQEQAKHQEEDEAEAGDKPKLAAGQLTSEEEKQYLKVRKKIIGIIRHEKIQAKLKDWIDELKKNAIIEEKI
jgi:peptidyl-prolyl cis-trans isomerase SurA